MARKKIVFVIVEGPSDDTALGLLLNQYYSPLPVHVEIIRGDITTETGATPANILSRVAATVQKYAKDNHLQKIHFQQIIHLVDTDGAYIGNESIVADPAAIDPIYLVQEIRTANKPGIENRNQRKQDNLNKLCSTQKIWDIPYQVYYMSCNLDHVLHNKPNSTDDEKEVDSYRFAKRYKDKPEEFVSFISCSDFSVMGGYRDSWNFIKEGLHSLERHTNLGICFQEENETVSLCEEK